MKRFIVSGIVIVSFVLFSLYYRVMGQSTISVAPSNSGTSTEPTATPVSELAVTNQPTQAASFGYKNGTFVGDTADAFYGNIQVQVAMNNGKITDVQFLQYPNDRSRSIEINQYAMPILRSEAIQAQGAQVDIVSGATDSSQAFIQSLQSALQKAKS